MQNHCTDDRTCPGGEDRPGQASGSAPDADAPATASTGYGASDRRSPPRSARGHTAVVGVSSVPQAGSPRRKPSRPRRPASFPRSTASGALSPHGEPSSRPLRPIHRLQRTDRMPQPQDEEHPSPLVVTPRPVSRFPAPAVSTTPVSNPVTVQFFKGMPCRQASMMPSSVLRELTPQPATRCSARSRTMVSAPIVSAIPAQPVRLLATTVLTRMVCPQLSVARCADGFRHG